MAHLPDLLEEWETWSIWKGGIYVLWRYPSTSIKLVGRKWTWAYEKNSASLTGKTISFARLVRKKMDMENMKKFVCLTGKKYHFPILL